MLSNDSPNTQHKALLKWTQKMITLCEPAAVHWCDGSQTEADALFAAMVERGMCIKLNEQKRPNSYLFRSDPNDVARVESKTLSARKTSMLQGPPITGKSPARCVAR